jgi:hypothetical protein
MMAELDIKLFYHKYSLQDLPDLSRIRLRVEFLFLNYYTEYERCYQDDTNFAIYRNTIMKHSSYIFKSDELADLNKAFGYEEIQKVLVPKRKNAITKLNFFDFY